MTTIRQARPDDAAAIARIMETVWPEEPPVADRIAAAIERGNRSTYVAENESGVVGFIDAFGTDFWELDLMVVDPIVQRQGIGKRLTDAVLQDGKVRGYTTTRGLIAVNNVASQQNVSRLGLAHDEVMCSLYVTSEGHHASDGEGNASLTPVETFRYRGGWVNEPFTEDTLAAAVRIRTEREWDVVGAVIPVTEEEAIAAAQRLGYEHVGDYHWWTMTLTQRD